MNRLLFILFFTGLLPFFSQAQWVTTSNGSLSKRAVLQFSAPNSSTVWAALADGEYIDNCKEITGSSNGGNTWILRPVTIDGDYQVNAVCALDDLHLWVVLEADTGGGCIAYSDDAGASWTRQDSAVFHKSPVWIHFWDDTTGVAVGNQVDNRFEIFVTTTGGLDWEAVPEMDIPVSLDDEFALTNSFVVKGDTVMFAGKTYGKIFISPNQGKTWSYLPFPLDDIKKVIFMDTTTLIAGTPGLSGLEWNLYISYDWAQHWESITGDGPAYSADLCGVPGAGNVLVSAGIGLSYSNDLGKSWKNFDGPSSDPSPYYNTIRFTDLTHAYAGGVNPVEGIGGIANYNGPAMSVQTPSFNEIALSVYPNPCDDFVNIQFVSENFNGTDYNIYDLTGRCVITGFLTTFGPDNTSVIDLSKLSPGFYVLHLAGLGSSQQKELIVR
ncbi:MAG: T9SS type A sorting domain-containing protein [Bacteroidales bacterium]